MTGLGLYAEPGALVGAAALIFVVWYIVSTIRQYLRLRHFNGPTIAGFSQIWLIRCVGGGRTHLDLHEVCQKYGMLVGKPFGLFNFFFPSLFFFF